MEPQGTEEDKLKNILDKVDNFVWIFVCVIVVIGFTGTGLFLILAYGIPLGNYERDMDMVFRGVQLIGFLLLMVFTVVVTWKGLDLFLGYLDRKHGNFDRAIDVKRWPKPARRTVRNTLTYMSGRVLLIVWDVLILCIVITCVLTSLTIGDWTIGGFFQGMFEVLGFWIPIRCGLILFYHLRNYSGKMLHYYKKYLDKHETVGVIQDLEESLQKRLLYYSQTLIITEDYFLAWCELDTVFHPIVIPFKEILQIRYEVRNRMAGGQRNHYNGVIVCKLRSGQSVDLYVGNWTQLDLTWQVLEYFKIPFENTRVPERSVETGWEITATVPDRVQAGHVVDSATSSFGNLDERPELVCEIDRWDAITRQRICVLIQSGEKIKAIKEIREASGLGLAEAKWIEEYMEKI